MKDYYKILGLTRKAEFSDVINSYNKSINFFNNKLNLTQVDKQIIKEIKEAYYVLGNYHNRRNYDNNLDGYKKINGDFTDRMFFRPDLKYNHETEPQLKNTVSDIMNNKKNRFEKPSNYSNFNTF